MAIPEDRWSPRQVWREFRLELEAAKNYHLSYALYLARTHRDVLLERLLPTLLYLKAVAILDDSLELWLRDHGHHLVAPYRDNLSSRLRYLSDHSILPDTSQLHSVRKRRNELAHEPGSSCAWAEVEKDVRIIENSLVVLELVRVTPKLEYFCERSALTPSTEPGISLSRTYSYGVREEGKPALEVSWTEKLHDD